MTTVFSVIQQEVEKLYLIEENAINEINLNGGEFVQTETEHKKLKQLIKNGDVLDIKEYRERIAAQQIAEKQTEDAKEPVAQVKDDKEERIKALEAELLKVKKQKPLSFEEAAKVYAHKAQVLRDIAIFEDKLQKLNGISIKPSSKNSLNTDSFKLIFQEGNYSSGEVLSTNNVLIISEFMEFMKIRIVGKINELKKEVQA